MHFSHLHCHTQFSLLDGAANIGDMLKKAAQDGQLACAITDHGNMFGAFQFVNEANKAGVKPIVGCEFYVVEDRFKKKFTKPDKDDRYHQLLLAKNPEGYKNLSKLCSLGWIEGKYGVYPRIDKKLIEQYHEGLIATTCCIGAYVPQTILQKGEEEGEKEFKWWFDLFGEDYFIELQRHHLKEQDLVNAVLLKWSKKYNVPVICSNDSHYTNQADYNAHDILLCINTGEKQSTPGFEDFVHEDAVVKNRRFKFPNDQFYFKTKAEMEKAFPDLPEAMDNTQMVVDKVEALQLKRDILLPNFPLPQGFTDQWEYLKHITMEGAKIRWGEVSPDAMQRLDFELFTIKTMGFAGYFLIVADFIKAGRELGVFIGPGRGSAAGSAVAYCIGITNIDPIKYNLLFERFLNPDRKSMPDIDTDFDDDGRQKVLDYVVDKYGKNQVAQIVTYGTMQAKTSIKDVARVLDLPLDQAVGLTKLVPDKLGLSLKRIMDAPLEGEKSLKEIEELDADAIELVKQLREIRASKTDPRAEVLREALVLEGSVRNTGVHAAGVIIAPSDLTELMPIATAKDSDFLLTQFEGKVIEDAGVIKMDFLGLKTLTIIKNCLKLIQKNHGKTIDIDTIDLKDEKTFELFQRGELNGVFQFESAGMQKYMKDLKPNKFEDLIAMNALYRPGPLEYIPNFIRRKHGQEAISYDLPEMQDILEETYGITVYQEQVMLLSQKLADFTKGDADVLRKAMGKKDRKTLDKLKPQFIEKASDKGHPKEKLEKIWTDWEAFAAYAFNKSHSTCYAFVAFQTAWLKTHYPAEYMAANLTNEKDNIDKVKFFMEECNRMGLKVLGPDVNESFSDFTPNKDGQIRFGLGGIKGVGEAAVEGLVKEREEKGTFKNIWDFSERVSQRSINKKTLESLGAAGAFDCFKSEGLHRAHFLVEGEDNIIEKMVKYANAKASQAQTAQTSLFGSMGFADQVATPKIPILEEMVPMEALQKEHEVVGFYISGHPLDPFKRDLEAYANSPCTDIENKKGRELRFGGMVTNRIQKIAKNGNPYCRFSVMDYSGTFEIPLFGKDYVKFERYGQQGQFIFVRGEFRPRFGNENDFMFNVIEIMLLEEVREKFMKSLEIRISLNELNGINLDALESVLTRFQGRKSLKFRFFDPSESMEADAFSRKFMVNPNEEFFKAMKEEVGIEVGLC
jgi:DNA polymerase-3 subunit alpha